MPPEPIRDEGRSRQQPAPDDNPHRRVKHTSGTAVRMDELLGIHMIKLVRRQVRRALLEERATVEDLVSIAAGIDVALGLLEGKPA